MRRALPHFGTGRRVLARSKCPSIILGLVVILAGGCRGKQGAGERRYPLEGEVLGCDPRTRQVTVSHEEIRGLMEAMTMPFYLEDEWTLKVLKPGHRIQATLVVTGERSWLEGVTIVEKPAPGTACETSGPVPEPEPGTEAPDVLLYNQDGQAIRLSQYRDRALLITFIYTRCPLPDYCPRMSRNFAQVQSEMVRDTQFGGRVRLISVSFDPERDKPEVLRKYGSAYVDMRSQSPFQFWEFASGTPDEVRRAARYFGLSYSEEKGRYSHNLRTALIGPDGRLVRLYRGNSWTAAEVLKDIRRLRW